MTTIYKATANNLKGQIDNNTIIVGDFNNPLTAKDRSTRQKINKETQPLNEALDQMDLIDIYRGVPIVAQWLRNPTRNHEVVGLIPALAQWVKGSGTAVALA